MIASSADVHAFFGASSNLEPCYCLGEASGEIMGNSVLHEDSVGTEARLAVDLELGHQPAFNRSVQVCIVENDERRLSAKFQ